MVADIFINDGLKTKRGAQRRPLNKLKDFNDVQDFI